MTTLTTYPYVIVGAGAAGISALEAIRSRDRHRPVALICPEKDGYYSRPGLAYYLSGELPEKALYPFRGEELRKFGVDLVPGQVVEMSLAQNQLHLEDGRLIKYEKTLLATGSSATRPKISGIELDGVVKLDTLADARAMVEKCRKAKAAVVVGGGITALEIVEGLRARNIEVHYFLRKDRYWGNVLDETESKIVEHRLEEEGVQLHYFTDLAEIQGSKGKVSGVITETGALIPCQIVAIAIGVQPNIGFAKLAGLKNDKGILVDQFMQTSDENVYAAGDIAQVVDPEGNPRRMDVLWWVARDQGTIAGLNMTGAAKQVKTRVPFNVTRLAGLTTSIIGAVGTGKDGDSDLLSIARGDSDAWREIPDAIVAQREFSVNRIRLLVGDAHLLGAVVMGDQTLSQPLHHLISQKVNIRTIRVDLLKPDAPLADILVDFWKNWRQQHATLKS